MLVLRWSQRAHYWFLGRPKGHIRGPKGHSALWKRPSENAAAAVGFDEDSLRCAGELEHSCKQHYSTQTVAERHTARIKLGQGKP